MVWQIILENVPQEGPQELSFELRKVLKVRKKSLGLSFKMINFLLPIALDSNSSLPCCLVSSFPP